MLIGSKRYNKDFLRLATAIQTGLVKIGSGINVGQDGTISVTPYNHPNFESFNFSTSGLEVIETVVVNDQGHVTNLTKRTIDQASSILSGYLSTEDWNTFNNKQEKLVSGTNIKTINSKSVLGSGDLVVGGVSIQDETGNQKWLTTDQNNSIKFEGTGDTVISFNATTRTVTINSIPGQGTGGNVTSVFGRQGGVTAQEGDYNLSLMGDVEISSPLPNQLLRYNQTQGNWENWTPNYLTEYTNNYLKSVIFDSQTGDLTFEREGLVDIVRNIDGRYVTIGTTYSLSGLVDVNLTILGAGDILKYNGTEWIPFTPNYLTEESDPIFLASPAGSITSQLITNWNLAYQGTHLPISLGSETNGLSLNNQTLSLQLASSAQSGALSSSNWNTFNSKQTALVSGTNIKTVGGVSILGSGDISLSSLNYWVKTGSTLSHNNRVIVGIGADDTVNQLQVYGSIRQSSVLSSLLKTDGTGKLVPAVPGVDYLVTEENHTILSHSDINPKTLAGSQVLLYNSGNSKWENVQLTSTNVTEGINKYYTDTRVRTAISLTTTGNSGAATYNFTTGVFNIPNYTLAGLGGISGINSSMVISALGYTPFNSANYIPNYWTKTIETLSYVNRVVVGGTTDDGSSQFQVIGTIKQSSVLSSLLKTDSSGKLVAATDGTDYWSPNTLTQQSAFNYWTKTGDDLSYSLGNVGVGINPSFKLDVNGDINISQFYKIAGVNALIRSGNYTAITDSDGFNRIYVGNLGDPNNYYDATSHSFRSYNGGVLYGIFNNNGLGIGTSSPLAKTHIVTQSNDGNVGTWFAGNFVVGQDGNSGGIGLSYSTTENAGYISSLSPSIAWRDLGYRASSHIFYTGGVTERLRINANTGNVGVGVIDPTSELTLREGFALGWRYTSSNSTTTHKITGGGANPLEFTTAYASAGTTKLFSFKGVSGVTAMSMFQSGNVVVGHSTEISNTYKLQVLGNTIIDGQLRSTSLNNFSLLKATSNGTITQATAADITSLLGTGNYIQNQTTVVQNAGFRVNGNVYVGSRLRIIVADADAGNSSIIALDAGLGKDLLFFNYATSSAWMRMHSSGNIVMGDTVSSRTDISGYKLQVLGNSYFSGRVLINSTADDGISTLFVNGSIKSLYSKIDESYYSGYASFSHRQMTGSGQYALLQSSTGETFLNGASGGNIYLRINNAAALHITGLRRVRLDQHRNYKVVGTDGNGEFVTAGSQDIIDTLGYTPYNATNPNGYTTASDVTSYLTNYVPTSRTITINGVTQNLAANRTWTISVPSGSKWTDGNAGGIFRNSQVAIGAASNYQNTNNFYINAKLQVYGYTLQLQEGTTNSNSYAMQFYNGITYMDSGSNWINFGKQSDGSWGVASGVNTLSLANQYVDANNTGIIQIHTSGVVYVGKFSRADYGSGYKMLVDSNTNTGLGLKVIGSILTTDDLFTFSDRRLKTNIKSLESVLDKFKNINAVSFVKNNKTGFGYIAQNIQELYPELVSKQRDGYLSMNYQGMIAINTAAIQEVAKKYTDQESRIRQLEKEVETLRSKLCQ